MDKKYIKYTVLDKHTLQLQESAKPQDLINLLDVAKIDVSIIEREIADQTNKIFTQRLSEAKNQWEATKQAEILAVKHELATAHAEALAKKEQVILQKEAEKSQLKLEIEAAQAAKINQLQANIQSLSEQLANLKTAQAKDIELATTKLENQKNQVISDLQQKLNAQVENYKRLEREKSSLNIKEIGEDLEIWCKRQYDSFSLAGFDNSTFDKITKDKDGEKPDYLFTAYAKKTTKPIVKVVCEMKSESLVEGNKKKNADHYAKLNSDRIRHGGEEAYALLISELEKDNDNIIEKVQGYDKMYMVRPAYFIPILSLIYSLSTKYEEIVIDSIEFEEKTKIINDFENMKNDIIDVTFARLKNHAEDVVKKIGDIKRICVDIENKHIEQIYRNMNTIQNKIESFSIRKVVREIEKTEL